MKVIILAGGLGTRLGNETKLVPKPMIKIGNDPIILHIIKIYKHFNFTDFIIAGGYRHSYIKNFFKKKIKNINVKVIYTGLKSMTGGRIYRLKEYIDGNQFLMTYGDGLANIDIKKLLKFHFKNRKTATMSVVRPPARWGYVTLKKNLISKFEEKNQVNEGWINGGFFVLEKKIFDYFKKFKNKDKIIFEQDILPLISKDKKLIAYKHTGFWQCMDTSREKDFLNKMIKQKNIPWVNFKK